MRQWLAGALDLEAGPDATSWVIMDESMDGVVGEILVDNLNLVPP